MFRTVTCDPNVGTSVTAGCVGSAENLGVWLIGEGSGDEVLDPVVSFCVECLLLHKNYGSPKEKCGHLDPFWIDRHVSDV